MGAGYGRGQGITESTPTLQRTAGQHFPAPNRVTGWRASVTHACATARGSDKEHAYRLGIAVIGITETISTCAHKSNMTHVSTLPFL